MPREMDVKDIFDTGGEIPPATPAATLVIFRNAADGGPPELLMVQRSKAMSFAGGAAVFPGGRVDDADFALADALGATDDEHRDELAARIAAVRETLEETALPVPHHTLVPFARWRPAFAHPRRFDTLFFLAPAPPGEWELRPQPGECESVEWLSAEEVLARIETGQASAIFPTIRNLERLAQFGSFAEARDHALAHPLEIISPWVEERGGEPHLVIPDHLGYPITAERLWNIPWA